MIVFPNCKINIGLNIIGRRADGYHNLETVFYPIPFYDVLEVIQNTGSPNSNELFLTGIKLDTNDASNLCLKAYELLKKDFPQLPAVKIYLHKTIPTGAGLGGGSADGACMLLLLNEKFNLNLNENKLIEYALSLGSDCPFFIINKPCFAQQRGEVLQPVQLNLSGYKLVLINPGIHIDTGWAFTQVKFSAGDTLFNSINKPVETWKENMVNDFELPVFKQHPEIQNTKNQLYQSGAIYASMSGSGSTVYGLFAANGTIDQEAFPKHYFIKEMLL